MNIPKHPKKPGSQLDYVIKKRLALIIDTVAHAISDKYVLLGLSANHSCKNSHMPAFYEGHIHVMNETRDIIPTINFIPIVETLE
jgi:hypothetical protein